ncbi:nuclear transport factor 2 family protein [Halobacteria archaeon AArc-m2/3/4]|uniref:Nuclear transport factor 2 family protein n=1 Tax=Natronoglomus mannanivorans TaxID=2979990 RepID=A0ABT2QD79_9EURY|nr:nuclear transport factor 2 family protein [Halobacteria archaeon AArc-m2/3/4]
MALSHADVQAIQRLKHEYCFTIDGGEYESWAGLFTEDGRFIRDSGETFEGYDELYAFASEGFDDAFDHSAHMVTNPVIDGGDGNSAAGEGDDVAIGRWYLLLFYRRSDGDVGWTQARYDDVFRKIDGEWQIAEVDLTYGVTRDD